MNNTEVSTGGVAHTQGVLLTVGIPASGKDTWARETCEENPGKYSVINRDKLRAKAFTKTGDIHDYKYTKHKERAITERQFELAQQQINGGGSVIVSDTNLNLGTRQSWAKFADKNGVPITYKVMETPLHVCIKRNAKRADYVPESVLIRMEKKMREYCGKYVHDKSNPDNLPECIIVDIDGTLADHTGLRGSFEWSKVGLDRPRTFVISVVDRRSVMGDYIIVFSGRDNVCRGETETWLESWGVPYNELHMRKEGSLVNDCIVKEEMFDKFIKGKYHVSHIIDDRHQVVNMWCSMGFDVMDVGNRVSDF